jgi:inorganic triphosphatase YgiF
MPLEREVKVSVPPAFVMPALDGVIPGVRAVDRGRHRLDATYWDTATLALQRAGFGLRYRTRDGKAGHWTLKSQTRRDGPAVVRQETDMDGEPGRPPESALEQVRPALGAAVLRPVATLQTERRIVDLVDSDGRRLAEVADDHVSIRSDSREVGQFREVEVELIDTPEPTLVDAVLERLRAAGAGEIDPTSKYVRALRATGFEVPDRDPA